MTDGTFRLDPKDGLAYFTRGTVYFRLGQFQRAIEDYDETTRLEDVQAVGPEGQAA